MILDRQAFIRTHTRLTPAPHTPAIRIHVADEATELWQKTEDELGEIGLPPPFWAFAWAGGQALARYILDNPDIVRGKRVLDFASGSGIVGIAAAISGASHVEACDIDAFSIDAIHLNAEANGVTLIPKQEDLIGTDCQWDIILAGDICYERDTADRVINWLLDMTNKGKTVLIGDPGRSYLPKDRLLSLATYEVPVTKSLEDSEVKKTSVWRFKD
ncbi:methyltransferase [Microvirga sp. W0021]|uniref:Methyltransferase n=1 Tax=Hohaiivirga grylli TaxID=3133970 RepID=A0ABV0BL80_9HYPH